ncbi:MAG: RNA polymerase sigma factor [Phycisphaerales bacterium]
MSAPLACPRPPRSAGQPPEADDWPPPGDLNRVGEGAREGASGRREPPDAREAVEALYLEHGRAALRLARRLTSPHGADDAVQEAFLRILLYARPAERVLDRAYVLAAVRNAVRDVARRGRERPLDEVPDHALEPVSAEIGIDLARVLRELAEPMASALELTIVRGLSSRRAAEATGVDLRTFLRRRRTALSACQAPLRLARSA